MCCSCAMRPRHSAGVRERARGGDAACLPLPERKYILQPVLPLFWLSLAHNHTTAGLLLGMQALVALLRNRQLESLAAGESDERLVGAAAANREHVACAAVSDGRVTAARAHQGGWRTPGQQRP